jgi:hypothetical protein
MMSTLWFLDKLPGGVDNSPSPVASTCPEGDVKVCWKCSRLLGDEVRERSTAVSVEDGEVVVLSTG